MRINRRGAAGRGAVTLALLGVAAGVAQPAFAATAVPTSAKATTSSAATTGTAATTTGPKIFAYYYLWWSSQHWHDKLGSNYPYASNPAPLPAKLDATGCTTTSLFAGNQLTDVPTTLESQDDAANIEKDVRQAAAGGLAGFVVNWLGTGQAGQTASSTTYSRRLDTLVAAVHKVNAEGIPFKLMLSLKASDTVRTSTWLTNDINYLQQRYGADSSIDHTYSPKLVVIWTGSRKYSTSALAAVSGAVRAKVALIGDETSKTWSASRAAYLDGDHYYWSSQDPYRNPQSFDQLRTLASMVRASAKNSDGSTKTWLAPLAPGYNSRLLNGPTGTCVPRNGGQTLKALYNGNKTSNPDGYTLISWNEIAEGTYIKPMQRYGTLFTDTVRGLTSAG